MSDHDAKFLICNIFEQSCNNYFYINHKIDKCSINDFNIKLSYELWEEVFKENDVNIIFNQFLHKYLKILCSSFPTENVHYRSINNGWLTQGIRMSCINKRKLFLIQRNINKCEVSEYYKKYCRILTKVIKLANKRY
jgi:hypothetical protein